MNLNQFFHRTMTKDYNCLDHAREVWREITGEDLADRLPKLQGRFADRHISLSGARTFECLPKPISPCIVLMQRPQSDPHVGVYFEGKVLQLGAEGVEYQPLDVAARVFKTVRFYK